MLFEDELGESRCRALCTIIYYPAQELSWLREKSELDRERLLETINCLQRLAESLSGKYTRNYVRKQMPEGYEFVLEELLHIRRDEDENQLRYHDVITESIVSTGAAEEVITALAELCKRLAVDRLHVVGDIFDRGPEPDRIMDMLMTRRNLDIQWGNHDILWLGAAAGSAACVFTVLRISLDYGNMAVLERGYGIPLRHLSAFCGTVYGSSNHKKLRQALSVVGTKLDGQIISRHPGYGMNDRLLMNSVDFGHFTVEINGETYPLNTTDFPPWIPRTPTAVPEEERLVAEYVSAFRESRELRRHMDFIYKNGSTYLCLNGNLLYHGCIPMTEDGAFARVRHGGKWYAGRALMDYADRVVTAAWTQGDEGALDMMWYLWCGKNSPFSGREFHTFERAFLDDEATWDEPKNPYFDLWEDADAMGRILAEFGLDPGTGHIINGHTPVKAKKGESPVKAGGRLFIIDGGFCKAYQPTTGIAGYTLIYNSHGIRLKAHRPFEGIASVLRDNADMESESTPVEPFPRRLTIADTDHGAKLMKTIAALNALLAAYRSGETSSGRTEQNVLRRKDPGIRYLSVSNSINGC
jgi:fructose-1,6-bisphosphatase-3